MDKQQKLMNTSSISGVLIYALQSLSAHTYFQILFLAYLMLHMFYLIIVQGFRPLLEKADYFLHIAELGWTLCCLIVTLRIISFFYIDLHSGIRQNPFLIISSSEWILILFPIAIAAITTLCVRMLALLKLIALGSARRS